MNFADRCVHCEHYHDGEGICCFCKKVFTPMNKTPDEHLAEVKEILDGENQIDV